MSTLKKFIPSQLNLSSRKSILFLIFISALFLLGIGLSAQPSVGDEIHHYRFAKNCFSVQGRALFDSIYASPVTPGFYYNTEVAWPLILSWIWRLLGHVSFGWAQVYQTGFYLLLILMTYLTGADRYGEKVGRVAALLTATMPMITSFSLLFYLDMPAAAMCMTLLYFLQKGHWFVAGFATGLAYLIKKNTGFLLPVTLLWMVFGFRKHFSKLTLSVFMCLASAGLLVKWDDWWRAKYLFKEVASISHLFLQRIAPNAKVESQKIVGELMNKVPSQSFSVAGGHIRPNTIGDFSNSSVLNVIDLGKYCGIAFFIGIGAYLFLSQKSRRDVVLWFYVIFFIGLSSFLNLFPDIRYLMPIAPILCLLSAKGIVEILNLKSAAKWLCIGLCGLQFFSAAIFTVGQRRLPQGILQAFEFARTNIEPDALVLYPETNFIEYAQRRMIWSRMNLFYLFWGSEAEKAEQILAVGLDYVGIKKNRTYDAENSPILHVGKYPTSFIRMIDQWPISKKVFENDAVSFYKIDRVALRDKYTY